MNPCKHKNSATPRKNGSAQFLIAKGRALSPISGEATASRCPHQRGHSISKLGPELLGVMSIVIEVNSGLQLKIERG
jgi:hypothetical protein